MKREKRNATLDEDNCQLMFICLWVFFLCTQEAISLLEPMTNDPVNYVRQGALIASALILIQHNEVICPKVSIPASPILIACAASCACACVVCYLLFVCARCKLRTRDHNCLAVFERIRYVLVRLPSCRLFTF